MFKEVTRTYTECICDKCGNQIRIENEFKEEFTCYCCGEHLCKKCRNTLVCNNASLVICKSCLEKLKNAFKQGNN